MTLLLQEKSQADGDELQESSGQLSGQGEREPGNHGQ